MSLADLQQKVFAAVTGGPESAKPALPLVQARGMKPLARLEIYGEMYFLRMRDTLAEDCPLTASLIGPDRFDDLVRQYVREYPSQHHSLARLGHAWPKFVKARSNSKVWGDLAELEWALADSFVAEDSAVLSADAPAKLAPEVFVASSFRLTPSFRLLQLKRDVLPVWTALKNGQPAPSAKERAVHVMVWRKGFEVFHVEVPADEAEAMRRALEGQSVEAMCEAFADRPDPVQAAFTALASWLNEGMVAELVAP